MKKLYIYILIFLSCFFTVNKMEVKAEVTAKFSIVDRHDIYLDSCNSSGSCKKSSQYTIYKKTLDGETAYCMQLNQHAPSGSCTRRDSWWNTNAHNALRAAQMIKIGNSIVKDKWEAYLKIQEALNCNYDSGYNYTGACSQSDVKNIINKANTEYNKYKYTELSNKSTLPKPKISGNKQLVRKSTGKYLSGAINITELVKTYGGESYETTKPSYTIKATPSKGTAYICDTLTTVTSNCSKSTKTITDVDKKTIYILLTGAGDNGGNVKLSISGSNASSYPTTYYWDCGSDSQRMITLGKNITITRSSSANYSLIYNETDKLTARIEKLNEKGEDLTGAKLILYTAKEDGDMPEESTSITICELDGTNSDCQKNDIVLDNNNYGYKNNRYICYLETEPAPKYQLKNSTPICEKINSNSSDTVYYLKFADDSISEEPADINNYNNKASYCNVTKYRDLTETYINTIIGNGLTDNPNLTLGDCTDNTSKATICIYQTTDGETTSYTYDSTGESCQSGEEADTGQKYCITKDSYQEIENKSCGTDGLIGESVCYNSSTNKKIADKFCASGTNLITVQSSNGSYAFTVENSLNEVLISKKSITGTAELPGAILSLYTTKNGECTKTLATSEAFTYSSTSNNGNSGIINYNNIATAMESLANDYDPAKDGLKWVSSSTPAAIQGLEPGTYCLQEEVAPMGYKKLSTTTKFKMNNDGSVELVGNENKNSDYDKSTNTLSIHDDIIKITISKQDMTTSEELPGATISICGAAKNKDGDYEIIKGNNGDCSVVTLINDKGEAGPATWVSTDKPHEIEGLGAGTYYLVEIDSPEGYAEAESIFFRVDENGNIYDKNGTNIKDSKIVMKDKKITNEKTGNILLGIISILLILAIGSVVYFKNEKESLV